MDKTPGELISNSLIYDGKNSESEKLLLNSKII